MKKYYIAISIVIISAILISATNQDKKWKSIPQEYKTMKNPVKSSEIAIGEGKDLWNTKCKSCHGETGNGVGVKTGNLGKSYRDLTTNEFQTQLTDGEIFYLTFVAKNGDHKSNKKITDENEKWKLVTYVRTFKK